MTEQEPPALLWKFRQRYPRIGLLIAAVIATASVAGWVVESADHAHTLGIWLHIIKPTVKYTLVFQRTLNIEVNASGHAQLDRLSSDQVKFISHDLSANPEWHARIIAQKPPGPPSDESRPISEISATDPRIAVVLASFVAQGVMAQRLLVRYEATISGFPRTAGPLALEVVRPVDE